ncbi:hypothetical protein LCGC14_2604060, partial [marine sediment metagenome]
MYAVIREGGKQYKVEPGKSIQIDLKENVNKGDTLEFTDVLMVSKDGTRKTIDDLSAEELKRYRRIQNLENELSSTANRSICSCITCGKADRDMTYNKAYDSWYCTECYDMH